MHRLDVVAVGIAYVGAVVAGVVVQAQAGLAVVLATRADRGRVELVHCSGVRRRERDVNGGGRLTLTDPQPRLSAAREAADAALELPPELEAERSEGREVEVVAAPVVAHLECDVVDHLASFRSWKTASMLLPSGYEHEGAVVARVVSPVARCAVVAKACLERDSMERL